MSDEDQLRARFYEFLAGLLSRAPDQAQLDALGTMDRDDQTDLGVALCELAANAAQGDVETISDEYDVLFVGMTGGVLNPYGSYYLTGFLHEKPLADLRADMARLGLGRKVGVSDPEDHIASILEMISSLIVGTHGAAVDLAEQQRFFDAHLGNWAPAFFEDLEQAEQAQFYRPVGRLGRLFMAVEKQAFAME